MEQAKWVAAKKGGNIVLLDPETGLKTCTKCRIPKSADQFTLDSRTPDKLHYWCTECKNTRRRERYITNREEILQRQRDRAWQRKIGESDPRRYIYMRTRTRLRNSDIPFAISEEDVYVPDRCPIESCGRELLIGRKSGMMSSPSLDRYDPLLGYVPGNVWVICYRCNTRKQDLSGEGHIAFGEELIDAFKMYKDRLI